ncbi:hypothetical protein G6F56_001814 [Rhizopus delemar]|nr:hypothetical protein G6F56_001814 [Rhizopus delemar]
MSNSTRSKRTAPCTIFSTTTLSPRQIANKAYTLGCKKLDRDDKRSNQKYHLRERVLLYNTITKAEEALNAKIKRNNRRVVSAEDDGDEHDEFSIKQSNHHTMPNQSRLREHQEEEDIPASAPAVSTADTTSTKVIVSSHLLHTDCNILNKAILVM